MIKKLRAYDANETQARAQIYTSMCDRRNLLLGININLSELSVVPVRANDEASFLKSRLANRRASRGFSEIENMTIHPRDKIPRVPPASYIARSAPVFHYRA